MIDPLIEESRLPAIAEGKHYPRRTLDAEELRRISVDTSNESPDLGPPPVAHFQDEDPIQFDPRSSARIDEPDVLAEEAVPAVMSVNLESRRRRRESNSKEIKRMAVFQSSSPDQPPDEEKPTEPPTTVRLGAKRKLSAREEEQKSQADVANGKEGFRFSRKANSRPDAEGQPNQTEKERPESKRETIKPRTTTITERRILGSKSVNTDPVTSPRKAVKGGTSDSKPDFKKPALPTRDAGSERTRDRKTKLSSANRERVEIPLPSTDKVDTVDIPPATPAGLDLFSPPSTNPSTAKQEVKDTPPPGEMGRPGVLGATDEGGYAGVARAARRARVQVNYAEPNLVSKMRRPTKELAPAVVEKLKAPVVDLTTDKGEPRSIVIKRERSETKEDSWKNLPLTTNQKEQHEEPNSPLSKKNGLSKTLNPESLLHDDVEEQLKQSSSAAAMAELMASASSSNRRTSRLSASCSSATQVIKKVAEDEAEQKRNKKVVLDAKTSSPLDPSEDLEASKLAQESLGKIRSSRRHSSIGQLSTALLAAKSAESTRARASKESNTELNTNKEEEAAGIPADRAVSRRRSMMI